MSSQPYISVRQTGIRDSAFATLARLSEIYGLSDDSFVGSYVDDESARLTITGQISDNLCSSFHDLFCELCKQTDWHVALDWDDFDETTDFPYKSLDRPVGAKEPVLLWPDD